MCEPELINTKSYSSIGFSDIFNKNWSTSQLTEVWESSIALSSQKGNSQVIPYKGVQS